LEATILVVDDEEPLRLLVKAVLEGSPYRVIEAANGCEALEAARKHQPDLVLMDWMMPDLSGIEVCAELLKDPETEAIKVLMLTAKGQVSDMAEAAKLQVRDYLVKPFRPAQLLAAIERLL
jgi:two-component system phosphate regulon response regulator PhoB